ncbi:hypothetical protein [Paraburkholderia ginsengiterrae]|uniref:hypothetical protein n=1 Tax=Paraburkholderia ginsengiterrae TaxID=1462993 RepID=UPI0007D9D526|nr:hypothetical protein [Paraburkholderia ginsengiterrae]
MDASAGINEQDAGLFSLDAYDPTGTAITNLGTGWTEDTDDETNNAITDGSGNVIDQFRIFTNSTLDQVVLAVVQIMGASENRRVHHCIIMLKERPSKQQAQWYL